MEGFSKNVEACPRLLDLIPKERELLGDREDERSSSEEKKLELRLGLPGEDWPLKNTRERHESQLNSFGYFTNGNNQTQNFPSSAENSHVWFNQQQKGQVAPPFLTFPSSTTPPTATAPQQSLPVMAKESSQPCCNKAVVELQQCAEKEGIFSSGSCQYSCAKQLSEKVLQLFTLLSPSIHRVKREMGKAAAISTAKRENKTKKKKKLASCRN
ncbi:auxin-responsive protein [Salix suchowensis]|nr:auxin-responsive protein [Salix suchowensis]